LAANRDLGGEAFGQRRDWSAGAFRTQIPEVAHKEFANLVRLLGAQQLLQPALRDSVVVGASPVELPDDGPPSQDDFVRVFQIGGQSRGSLAPVAEHEEPPARPGAPPFVAIDDQVRQVLVEDVGDDGQGG
jgi:hypothetical protein